jgi:transcriptional regulator with XRE-family HTH domain
MTQEELAAAAGVSKATIQNVESDRTSEPHKLEEIARALGVSAQDLLGYTRPDPTANDDLVIRVRNDRERRILEALLEQMRAEEAAGPQERLRPDELAELQERTRSKIAAEQQQQARTEEAADQERAEPPEADTRHAG